MKISRRWAYSLCVLVAVAGLAGCGSKGDLVRPPASVSLATE